MHAHSTHLSIFILLPASLFCFPFPDFCWRALILVVYCYCYCCGWCCYYRCCSCIWGPVGPFLFLSTIMKTFWTMREGTIGWLAMERNLRCFNLSFPLALSLARALFSLISISKRVEISEILGVCDDERTIVKKHVEMGKKRRAGSNRLYPSNIYFR